MNAVNRFIEQLNYDNDARVRAAREQSSFVVYDENDEEHELPTTWGVCPTCHGEGVHTNPSIDCGGLTAKDFDDDPDFAAQYMGYENDKECCNEDGHSWHACPARKKQKGRRATRYDVTCYGCDGMRVVRVVDESQLTPELKAAWHADKRAAAECRAMEAAERRMGC